MKPLLGPVLLWFADDVIAGDLLEEYREERFPRLGRRRAELWYLRQVLSIVWHGIPSGLLILCLLSALCAGWLMLMEMRLQHRGFISRSFQDFLFLAQAALALLAVPAQRARGLRGFTLGVTATVFIYAALALFAALTARHFEGYALVAAIFFLSQSATTFAALSRTLRKA